MSRQQCVCAPGQPRHPRQVDCIAGFEIAGGCVLIIIGRKREIQPGEDRIDSWLAEDICRPARPRRKLISIKVAPTVQVELGSRQDFDRATLQIDLLLGCRGN